MQSSYKELEEGAKHMYKELLAAGIEPRPIAWKASSYQQGDPVKMSRTKYPEHMIAKHKIAK
jgi:hypothetical protein